MTLSFRLNSITCWRTIDTIQGDMVFVHRIVTNCYLPFTYLALTFPRATRRVAHTHRYYISLAPIHDEQATDRLIINILCQNEIYRDSP